MDNFLFDIGPWVVDVHVNGRRVDHKEQGYAPHGRVNPVDAPPSGLFVIDFGHLFADGWRTRAVGGYLACIIP
jgi:hypothetical protein